MRARRLARPAPLLAALLALGLAAGSVPAAAHANAGEAEGAVSAAEAQAPASAVDPASGEQEPTAADPAPAEAQPAPIVAQQPEDVEADAGSEAVLVVVAEHAAALQWQRLAADGDPADHAAWTDLDPQARPSAAADRLVLAPVEAADAGVYRVRVTGADGAIVDSETAELRVLEPASEAEGEAEGDPEPAPEAGEAAPPETGGATTGEADPAPAAEPAASDPAARSTAPKPTAAAVTAPVITTHPSGSTVREGQPATFTAAASGTGLSVQWQSTATALANGEPDDRSWQDVPGATSAKLTITSTTLSSHGTFYRAVFTNSAGSATSYPAQLRLTGLLDTSSEVTVEGTSYGPAGFVGDPFSASAPNAVVAGKPIVIEGSGYLATDDRTGSVANFMIDASYSGDPNTLSTRRSIVNPATGKVFADKRSHGIVQAKADGTWRIEIPWPDETNTTQTRAFFDKNWQAGSQHMVRILTGSLLTDPADRQRGITVRFTVVDSATAPAVAPQITAQPEDVSATAGEQAAFTANASGTPVPTVRWQSRKPGGSWAVVSGATDRELVLRDLKSTMTGTQYRAVFTNSAGSATTAAATLAVAPSAVGVKTHPSDQRVEAGERARFTAAATGAEIVTSWERSRDGEEWETIRGATDPALVLEGATETDAQWRYRARFTNPGSTEGVVTSAASLVVTPRANVREHCGSSYGPSGYAGRSFCFTGPEKVVVGEDIVIRGTGGYLATDGRTGSVVNFFLDALYSGDPNTVYVKQPVKHPVTGKPVDDRRTHAMVQAKADGTWTVRIPWPTAATASKTADGRGGFSEQELAKRFAPGTTHAVRMLSGSLLASPTDVQRGASLFFTVVEDLRDPVAVKKPIYPHETYRSAVAGDDAVAWAPTTADSGSSFPLTGTGWLTKDHRAGSVVDIRLKNQSGTFYRHAGTAADPHPVADDPTVWQRVHVRSTGVLDTRVELPDGVRGGSYVAMRLTTTDDGTALGDVARNWTSKPITVDGAPWTKPVQTGCTASASTAAYELAPGMKVPAAQVGGTIRLTGKNWCNVNTGRGSYIAVKINDGKISHTGGDVAQVWNAKSGRMTGDCKAQVCRDNTTIWFVIEADDRGSFDVEIPLPTRKNSHPAFSEGAYTLRLMTATLSSDPVYDGKREASRTMRTPEFTVVCETCGTALAKPGRPTAAPDPLHVANDLRASKRGGVRLEQHADRWTVTVPKGSPGDWVYVNVYDGATPRFPWKTEWFELDGNRRAVLPLDGVQLPTGTNKVSVQNRSGGLLGWTTATVQAPDTAATGSDRGRGLSGARFAPASQQAAKPKPGTVPQQPVGSYRALTKANAGDVSAKLRDGRLTVTLPEVPGGDWVYLFLYTEGGRVVPIDWVQVGSDHTISVELGGLPSGAHKLAFVGEDGELVGWVKVAGPKAKTVAEPDAERLASAGVGGVGGVLAAIAGVAGGDGGWTLVLIGLAVLLLAGAAVAMILLRAPVPAGAAEATAGAGPGAPGAGGDR